jgi:hypothetical protein
MTDRPSTDRMVLHIRQTWLDGYQRAVETMRDWADDFGDEQSKAAIRACADMVEAAKPTMEMLEGLNV